MNKKRSVLIGMMSEICMKGRILLSKVKKNPTPHVLEEAAAGLDGLESEMTRCVSELERLIAK